MNNQTPYGWNPNFPIGPGPVMPFPPQGNCNCEGMIKNLEGKITKLERQVKRLEDRVSRIESMYQVPTPYSDNNNFGTSNNYSSGYNMM